jgi:hypothetical protein
VDGGALDPPLAYNRRTLIQSAATGKTWLGGGLRKAEGAALAFFTYTAVLSLLYPLPPVARLLSLAAPPLLLMAWCWAAAQPSVSIQRARDWTLPAAVLAGYWQMGWFAQSRATSWEQTFLAWDRLLLDTWGLRTLLEQRAPFLPWLLELSYLLLYVIPPTCLAVLYRRRAWKLADRYLFTLAAGTFTAYALLPALPLESPRLAFAGQDLPSAHSLWRDTNVWILDRLDISTSVFPSGHVAVAFSSAFGIKRALPGDLTLFASFFGLACSVYLATIYGRYHYAADGLASIGISLAIWRLCEILQPSA